MGVGEFSAASPALDQFLERFSELFGSAQNHSHARKFIAGLLSQGRRRNSESIAEVTNSANVRSLQAFISSGAWRDAALLQSLRRYVFELLGDQNAIYNFDEIAFVKKGTKSVGVKRQHCRSLGRSENCQVGVFANYCSSRVHLFTDRRLFLPPEWVESVERRDEAGIPRAVIFRSRPELALEMVESAIQERTPFGWVGADSIYGDSIDFLQGVRHFGKWYLVEISSDTRFSAEPSMDFKSHEAKINPDSSNVSLPDGAMRVDRAFAALSPKSWRRISVSQGDGRARIDEYAQLWGRFSEGTRLGQVERVIARRDLTQEPQLSYFRSNSPDTFGLETLASVRSTKESFQRDVSSIRQCGLDEYETRGWIGWHHHTALVLVARAFQTLT